MIALVLEMSGVPSLAFAVGIYLPLSSTSPIWAGGIIRWLVDAYTRRKHRGKDLTKDQLMAEGDKSPGVLLASGYIAGGALAGIAIALLQGVDMLAPIDNWFTTGHRPQPALQRPVRRRALDALLPGALRAPLPRRP